MKTNTIFKCKKVVYAMGLFCGQVDRARNYCFGLEVLAQFIDVLKGEKIKSIIKKYDNKVINKRFFDEISTNYDNFYSRIRECCGNYYLDFHFYSGGHCESYCYRLPSNKRLNSNDFLATLKKEITSLRRELIQKVYEIINFQKIKKEWEEFNNYYRNFRSLFENSYSYDLRMCCRFELNYYPNRH